MVYGVSADDVDSHGRFRDKLHLNFPLLADPDHTVCKAYGVTDGTGFPKRQTFVIGPDGTIVKHVEKVDAATHPKTLLAEL